MVDLATVKYKVTAVDSSKNEYDITDFLESLSWSENKNELAVRISFSCRNQETRKGYLAQIIKPGCLVRVHARHSGNGYKEVARGTVVTWNPSNQSSSHDFRCVCYDGLYNLQKSQDSFFFRSGTGTKTRINKILNKWKVPLGRYEGPDKKHGKKKYQNKYLSDIILDILDDAVKKGGQKSILRMEKSKVVVVPECSNQDVYVFNASSINGASRDTSTENLVTRVKVIGKSKEKGKESVTAVIDGLTKYGVRQRIYTRGSDESLKDAKKAAQEILNEDGKITKEISVQAPDMPYIHKGDMVCVDTRAVNGYFVVSGIQHDASGYMEMDIKPCGKNNVSRNKNDKPAGYRAGDIVSFKGGTHYVSSSGTRGYKAKAGKAEITKVDKSGSHPYHLVHTDNSSNVYGWVDSGSFS